MIISNYYGDDFYDAMEQMKKDLEGKRARIEHITSCYNPKNKKMEVMVIYSK